MIQSDTDLIREALSILASYNVQATSFCAQSFDASQLWNISLCHHNNNTNPTTIIPSLLLEQSFSINDYSTNQHHRMLQDSGAIPIGTATVPNLLEQEAFIMYNTTGTVFCIFCVALISCLYLGLLTLDVIDLEIIQRVSIDENEIMYATNLLPIVKQRHRLLVTLLVLNTVTMETLPIFLNNLVPEWGAILLSTTLILLFGEIIPSAISVGPNQLYLGNRLASLTKFFMWLLTPITTPLVMLLDYIVHGSNEDDKTHSTGVVYNRNELAALVRIQHESRMAAAARNNKSVSLVKHQHEFQEKKRDESWNAIKKEIMERVNERLEVINERNAHSQLMQRNKHSLTNGGSSNHTRFEAEPPEPAIEQLNPPLHPKEVDLITGALQMKTRLVMDEYTPLRKVYALPDTLILNLYTVAGIYAKGYSRIPVYEVNDGDVDDKTAIKGFFLIRQLILIDWDHEREISTLPLQRPDCISPRMNLVECLELLRTGGTLMAFVCAVPEVAKKALENEQPIPKEAGFMGIITLEDVMESVLQGRIHDEWDIKDRDRAIATLHRWAATKLQTMYRKKRSLHIARQLRMSGSFGAGSATSSPTKDMFFYQQGSGQGDYYGTNSTDDDDNNNNTTTLFTNNLYIPDIGIDDNFVTTTTNNNTNNRTSYSSTTTTRNNQVHDDDDVNVTESSYLLKPTSAGIPIQ